MGLWQAILRSFASQTIGPNMSDIHTHRMLGYMAWNAYFTNDSYWYSPIPNFKILETFGFSNNNIRGYVYSSTEKDLIIVSLKGTSPAAFGIGGPTSPRDKLNDNTMFSCCCLGTGCGCSNGTVCSETCVVDYIRSWSDSYWRIGVDLIKKIIREYPQSSLWVVGHSLGGALAGTLAFAFNLYGIAFEAPGDALFAHRLGFVSRPGSDEYAEQIKRSKVYYIGNTGDPIFKGTCSGYSSSCFLAGYDIRTKCHLGRECVYNTTGMQSINKHRMGFVMDLLHSTYIAAPCEFDVGCSDCA